MQIEDIQNSFQDTNNPFPKEALKSALEQQEVVTPYLLSLLQETIVNFEKVDNTKWDHIFALFILSKFREKHAFPYVIDIASLPDEWPSELLGDCLTEDLPRFIVSTFNDDLVAIKKLIENPEAYKYSRGAAIKSLLGLVATDKLKRDDLIDYLRTLFHSSIVDDEFFAAVLVDTASCLYPEELMPDINKAFDEDKVDLFFIDKKDVNRRLAMGKDKCLEQNLYRDKSHLPVDKVIHDLSWLDDPFLQNIEPVSPEQPTKSNISNEEPKKSILSKNPASIYTQ